ncbi:hypothetical protein ACFV3R_25165 [Streptomyces sp. NPDC059740]|uniref:hypothetical protein n=1 Tax=Streptomyces sp. NPDC059740 TaxID=3346926 RepID=UPI003664485B
MTGDTATVPDLARTLLEGVGNEAVNAAVGLLAAHQDGFWLRELLEPDGALASAVTREEGRPWVEWDAVGALIDHGLPQSSSEIAVLAVAASIAGQHRVNLHRVFRSIDNSDIKAVVTALTTGCIF